MYIVYRLLLLPFIVLAQPPSPELIPESGIIGTCNFITGEMHFDCIPMYLGYLIKVAFGFLGGMFLFQIIQAGYEWAFSGLQSDTQKPKTRIKNALLGLIFAVLSFLIVDTVISVLLSGPPS